MVRMGDQATTGIALCLELRDDFARLEIDTLHNLQDLEPRFKHAQQELYDAEHAWFARFTSRRGKARQDFEAIYAQQRSLFQI